MSFNVLVATGKPEHRASFGDAFAEVAEVEVAGYVEGFSELEAAMFRFSPDVIVLDDTLEPESATEIARILLERDPATPMLLWADRETSHTLADALEAGMRGVLTRPLSVEDAISKITAAGEWGRRLRSNSHATPRSHAAGTLVAVFGAKGGVGTSTLAIQLARLTAASGWPSCVLVDFDVYAGDLPSLLDLSHQRSVLDLVPVSDHLNERYLSDALYVHPSGIRVLPGPARTEQAEEVTEPIARRVLGALRSYFPFVVVDCGSRLDDANAVAIEIADHALMVTVPEVPCLLAARRHLGAFSRLNIRPDQRVMAVVNRQSKRSEFQVADIRRTLDIPVADAAIPDREAAFHTATNDADPTRLEDKAVLRALRKLSRQLGLLRGEELNMAQG